MVVLRGKKIYLEDKGDLSQEGCQVIIVKTPVTQISHPGVEIRDLHTRISPRDPDCLQGDLEPVAGAEDVDSQGLKERLR